MRTECHATTDVFRFARHIQPTPSGTCSDDNRRCTEHLATFHGHLLFLAFQIRTLDTTVLKKFDGIVCEMRTEIVRQLITCSIRYRNKILDAHRFLHLSADAFCHHCHLQSLAGRINGCRCSGRTTAQDQHIEMMMDWLIFTVSVQRTRRVNVFQLFQQFTE